MVDTSEGQSAPAFPIASDLRGLLEYVAERLDLAGIGTHRLDCEFRGGRLCKLFRHEGPIPATALGVRFGDGQTPDPD